MFVLFLILIIVSICISYHFYNICYQQKRQLLLLSKQNSSLRQKLGGSKMKSENITLLYKSTKYTYGVISNPCKLYICPLRDSYILCTLNNNLDVQILDCVEVFQEIWYEIRFISETNTNNKGWIPGRNISIFKNSVLQTSTN
jgi:hypothetical protein